MPEKKPLLPVKLEYLNGAVSSDEIHLFLQIFGREALRYLQQLNRIASKKTHTEYRSFVDEAERSKLLERIDAHFFDWLCRTFPDVCHDPREFVNRMLDESKMVQVEIISQLFYPEFELVMSLRNSVQALSAMPHMWIEYLSKRSAAVSVHETLRTLIIALICAQIEWRTHADKHNEILSQIQKLADEELFSGRFGESEPCTVYSLHGNENEVIGWSLKDCNLPDHPNRSRVKAHQLSVRTITNQDTGKVWKVVIGTRKKSVTSAVLKAFEKSQTDEASHIKPFQEVLDMLGMQFIVIGNDDEATSLIEYLSVFFNSQLVKQRFSFESIKRKDTATGKGASPFFRFRRLKMKIAGLSFPMDFEVIVKSMSEYLNGEYHHGKHHVTDGTMHWDGASHTIKELQRMGNKALLNCLFPDRIYKQNGIGKSPWWFVQAKLALVVQQLKQQNGVGF